MIKFFFLLLISFPAWSQHQDCETLGGYSIPIRENIRFNYFVRNQDGSYSEQGSSFPAGRLLVIGHDGERGGCYAMIADENGFPLDGHHDLVILPNRYLENAIILEAAFDANNMMEEVRSYGDVSPVERCPGQPDVHTPDRNTIRPVARPRQPATLQDLTPITGYQGLNRTEIPHEACLRFVDEQGNLGEYGQIMQLYFETEGDDSSLFNNDMPGMAGAGGVCPNWRSFSREQKIHYWAYFFAALASDESGCNPAARNPRGTDGVAAGLLQMPEHRDGQTGYYWRGANCRTASDMYDPRQNIFCSLDIMKETLLGSAGIYQNSRGLYGGNIYWEQLKNHSDGGDIGPMMATYRDCFN